MKLIFCAYHLPELNNPITLAGSFNLFQKFVGTRENESSQNSSSLPTFDSHGSSRLHQTDEKNLSNIPASNSNWFFSLFTSNERKTASKQGFILSSALQSSKYIAFTEESS